MSTGEDSKAHWAASTTRDPQSPAAHPLAIAEMLLAVSVACIAFASYHLQPVLPVLGIPFLVFGFAGRLKSRNRGGWAIGAYAGSVAFAAVHLPCLGVMAVAEQWLNLEVPIAIVFGVWTTSISAGVIGGAWGGRHL